MMSLPDDRPVDIIDTSNITFRYLADILNMNSIHFDNKVSQIYPAELQHDKVNTFGTEAPFLDLHLSTSNDIVTTKIYHKRDDFEFETVNVPF